MYDINKLNKELNKKIKNKEFNNFKCCEHIIFNKQDFANLKLKQTYDDQKAFDLCEYNDFLQYEKWLEDINGDKKR